MERKKIVVVVDESLGKFDVCVSSPMSNMRWAMGLHFVDRETAEEFGEMVKHFVKWHPGKVSF